MGSSGGCYCTKTVNGDTRCLDYTGTANPTTDECDRNTDCGTGQFCAQVGGCACPQGTPQRRQCKRRNKCLPLCTS
jgi:hypothetical protein